MKKIFALCALILIAGAVYFWQQHNQPIIIGEFTAAPKVEIGEVIDHPQKYLNQTVTLEGTVANQCTSMGCYFFFVEGTKELRVDLAEIAMNAPMGKNGHHVTVEGRTQPRDKGYQFSASAVKFD